MVITKITKSGIWCSYIPRAIGRTTMHQNRHLHHRVLGGALVMPERSAVKVARCVLRGERSREAPDLPGAYTEGNFREENTGMKGDQPMSSETSRVEVTRSADGTSIGFVQLGAGPAVVFVHGSLSTGDDW